MGDEQRPTPDDHHDAGEHGAEDPAKPPGTDETHELSEPAQAPGADATTQIRPGDVEPEPSAPAWQGRAGVPPPPGAPGAGDRIPPGTDSAPYGYDPHHPPRTWWTPILLGLLALALVALILLGAWLALRDRNPAPVPTGGPTPTPATGAPTTAQPTTAGPSASPSPSTVAVPPNLVGMAQQQATAELTKAGLNYRVEFEVTQTQPDGIVLRTDPLPGTVVPVRSTVLLVLSYHPPQPSETAGPTTDPTPSAQPTEADVLPATTAGGDAPQ